MLAGTWRPPTLDGPRTLTLNGRPFAVPDACEVKVVAGSGGVEIAHVRYGDNGTKLVAVLSAEVQLLESHAYAVSRANTGQWQSIDGEAVRPT
jgi:hypothetical protein